jgi:hypothetical protein
MNKVSTAMCYTAMLTLAVLVCVSGSAAAQSGAASDPGATRTDRVQATIPPTPASTTTKAELKSKRKAERRQARAVKNAELKRLEDAGYQPSQYDPSYPANLQNAEKPASGK